MLLVLLLSSLCLVTGQSLNLLTPSPKHEDQNNNMINCVIGILDKYFSKEKVLTYVNMNLDNDELLRRIHTDMQISLVSRKFSAEQMTASNRGYLIFSRNVEVFTEYFGYLIRERLWNPYARFLIIIEILEEPELRQVFDQLLYQHVNNAVVVNGTEDAHLYTYNPFDKYACGRYYDTVINYGLCSEAKHDLYPNKLVTGLRNCTFRGSLAQRPPFTIDPTKNEYRNKLMGLEQFVLKTVSESDEFKIDFQFNYEGLFFPTVTPNMTAIGGLEMLQKNETDVIFGAMMIIVNRADAFSYVHGHHDNVDELRFAVRKASFVPNWKYFYLEFDPIVWFLLMLSLGVYSMLMMFLLPKYDKGKLVLALLDNLLLHGSHIRSSMSIKCVLLAWIWFAYLVNTFYQSSLVSLTTNPAKEHQISDEEDMAKYNLKPCINVGLRTYIYTDTVERIKDPACDNVIGGMKLVSKSKNMFSLIPSYSFMYNKQSFNDKWGDPLIYYFEKPYWKLLMGYYFYKGFPISPRFKINMLRMRESGLTHKNLHDQYFMRSIKFVFAQKDYEYRFVFPWGVYIAGSFIATLSFLLELLSKYIKFRIL